MRSASAAGDQRQQLIEAAYRLDLRRRRLPLPREKDGGEAGLRRSFDIVPQAIADVQGLRGFDGMLLERHFKNLGRRLGRVSQAGDGDRVEELGDAQSSQDIEQTRVEV